MSISTSTGNCFCSSRTTAPSARTSPRPSTRTPSTCGSDFSPTFVVIGAVLWWRPPASQGSGLPPERLTGALVIGFRHARYNANLRATLIRAVAFFFFASAYWALLPLVARNQIAGGPELYGILLGAIGIGAVVGAFTLPSMKAALGSDRLVAA